jgi:hypothetical protein
LPNSLHHRKAGCSKATAASRSCSVCDVALNDIEVLKNLPVPLPSAAKSGDGAATATIPLRVLADFELSVGVAAASRAFGQQFADDHEIVGKHRGGNEQSEALGAFGAATLHAAAAHQH